MLLNQVLDVFASAEKGRKVGEVVADVVNITKGGLRDLLPASLRGSVNGTEALLQNCEGQAMIAEADVPEQGFARE
eukprot:12579305-Alexandrium_andersonii.AAC.1